MVLAEFDPEWLQGRSQLASLQADPAQFRNECQAFLAGEEATIT